MTLAATPIRAVPIRRARRWRWDTATDDERWSLFSEPDGYVITIPDGGYKRSGRLRFLWWSFGRHRLELPELDQLGPPPLAADTRLV